MYTDDDTGQQLEVRESGSESSGLEVEISDAEMVELKGDAPANAGNGNCRKKKEKKSDNRPGSGK